MKEANMREQLPVSLARVLRKNQTAAEQKLWKILRNRQIEHVKFRRQQRIDKYIVDFISIKQKLIIEVDGGQHAEAEISENDAARTRYLEKKGYRVLRFWNNDILSNPDGVWRIV